MGVRRIEKPIEMPDQTHGPADRVQDTTWRFSDSAFQSAMLGNMTPVVNEALDRLPSEEQFQNLVRDILR